MLKRFFIAMFALLMLCSCRTKEPDFTETFMVVNPFTTHDTLAEAEEVSGLMLTLPEDLTACENITYRSANNETLTLLEAICVIGDDEVRIRKGISEEDISGVYTEYSVVTESCGDELSFTMQGDGKQVFLATWSFDGYRYSIFSKQGVDAAILQEWVYATK